MPKIFSLTSGLGKTAQSTEAVASEATKKLEKVTPLGFAINQFQKTQKARQEFLEFSERIGLDPRIADLATGGLISPTKILQKGPQIVTKVKDVADDALSKLTQAVRTAEPLRRDIETAYTAERARRFSQAAEIQRKVGGQEGYFAGLSIMKGKLVEELPTFTPPSQSLEPSDVKSLYNAIQQSPLLDMGNQLTGQRGLTKLLDGHVPVPSELKVLEEVFGSDVVRALWDRRPLTKKIWDLGMEIVADIPRALKTTLDMSATLRQGIVLGTKHPIRFSQAFARSFKQMLSNNTFEEALDTMRLTPEYRTAINSGLQLADPRKLMGQREEYFLGQLAEKIPVVGTFVKASNRAYVGFSNSLRFDVFNDLAQDFATHGNGGKRNLEVLADLINTATGRGKLPLGLERSASAVSRILFAPKYVMSRLRWFDPTWYAKQPAPVREEALKTFASFVGTVSTVITLAKLGGADVETDWRSSNFGKMKVGNSYYDFTAGFGLYIRLFGQMVTGERKTLSAGKIEEFGGDEPFSQTYLENLERSLRAKLAPLPATIADFMAEKTVVGEKVTAKSELLDQVTPLYLQDLTEAIKDRGPSTIFTVGIPAFFGIGVQTFGDETKIKSLKNETEETKPKKIKSLR